MRNNSEVGCVVVIFGWILSVLQLKIYFEMSDNVLR